MGYEVTIIAFREFLQNAGGVGGAVAALTIGNGPVFSRMAKYAGQVFVFGLVCAQKIHCLLMAGAA
jgi:hypothetical protein